jgi:hypothetical protein
MPPPPPAWRTFAHAAQSTPADYTYTPGSLHSNAHRGQCKLLRAEQEFLLRHLPCLGKGQGDVVVVYAGAGPGAHIAELIAQFPHVRFALYDKTPFSDALQQACKESGGRVYLCQSFFTDADARAWRQTEMSVLFVSDIRTAVHDKSTHHSAESKQEDDARVEMGVARDMDDQARWLRLMQPRGALLKFRPPYWYAWSGGQVVEWSYLPGHIMLPCWGPAHTSECRLDVDVEAALHGQLAALDIRHYQNVMAFFNAHWRPAYDAQVDARVLRQSSTEY